MTPPADSTSLLVPIHVDAWGVDSTNQELTTWYEANYANLQQFESPIDTSTGTKPAIGNHVHWALPDALTRGRKADAAAALEFPYVPNRWLVARFSTYAAAPFKAWVIQSDSIGAANATQGSAFLNPTQPTYMTAAAGQSTVFHVNQVQLGANYTIESWEANPVTGGDPFLTAVGPANVSFAAYMPFAKDVFSFVDGDLPAEGTGTYAFTYMVVGWFSDPATMDPLRGVTTYIPGVWKSQDAWQEQTAAQRFQTLLTDARWSVNGEVPPSPPVTSLYHGTTVGVSWPIGGTGEPTVKDVTIAVGNTSTDALAALIQAYADHQGVADPANQPAWDAAGSELAGLVQATMLDALDIFGTPGSQVLMQQRIEDSWFGSAPGGTVWEVVAAAPQSAGQSAATPQLTLDQQAALNTQLAALNLAQRKLDEDARELASLQETLYGMWLRVGRANSFGWGQAPTTTPQWPVLKEFVEDSIYPNLIDQVWDQLCANRQEAATLPDPTDADAANAWAEKAWSFPAAEGGGAVTLSALGLGLKAGADSGYSHPNDPVVMISGADRSQRYGEDGRCNADGTMTCRLPGQSITGVAVAGQPAVTVQALQAKGLAQNPLASYTQVPSVPSLVTEAYIGDPANAPAMATAVSGVDATELAAGIESLLDGTATAPTAWEGDPPASFALADGSSQAWAPLFLEWQVNYYPTGSGTGQDRPFSIGDWDFDGQEMSWRGTGFDLNDFIAYTGRTLLTPQAPLLFKQKIEDYLTAHSTLDTQQMEELIDAVSGWDLLSQSLSGLTEQLLTLASDETFPPSPTATQAQRVQCPRSGTPDVPALIGEQYRYLPVLNRSRGGGVSDFYPLRGGFLQLQSLKIVDVFSQTIELAVPNTPQGFEPVMAKGIVPDQTPKGFPVGIAQLPPRVAQDTRLDFRFLANDGTGLDIAISPNPNPVCGWLIPNHLDGGISVYDGAGTMLGELLPLPAPDNWRPRPGDPGPNPPPAQPSDIPNAALRAVVASIAAQTPAVFEDVLETIDETLWTVDPLGGRKDQFLSVLIGRPLAVVQAQLGLSQMGEPAFDQTWNAMAVSNPSPPPGYTWNKDAGDVGAVPFPVRLGDLDIRADGLIGYYLPSESYSTFHTVHLPDDLSGGDAYIKQIATSGKGGPPVYQGGLTLNVGAEPTTVTLVMDPRGPVHAFSGILPVTTGTLSPHLVEDFVKQLAITFRTGPIVSDPGTLRVPMPGGQGGAWDWVQATPTGWEQDPIVAADDVARLPDDQLELREGWLRLTGGVDS